VILGILADDDETFIPIIEDIQDYKLHDSSSALALTIAVEKTIRKIEKDVVGVDNDGEIVDDDSSKDDE
jgi:hypothetical protein